MGKLYFYYSAMNAGKTTTLLQSAFNYNERGMETLLYIPQLDDRSGTVGLIQSRIGLEAPAIAFDFNFDFYEHISALPPRKYSCLLIDEAQFLTKHQVKQLALAVDEFNVPVLAYGLRTDFRGDPFEGSKYLLAWADELNEIKTICHCGRKATFNARINAAGIMEQEGAQIEIAFSDKANFSKTAMMKEQQRISSTMEEDLMAEFEREIATVEPTADSAPLAAMSALPLDDIAKEQSVKKTSKVNEEAEMEETEIWLMREEELQQQHVDLRSKFSVLKQKREAQLSEKSSTKRVKPDDATASAASKTATPVKVTTATTSKLSNDSEDDSDDDDLWLKFQK